LAAQLEKVKTLQVIKEIIVNTHPFQTGFRVLRRRLVLDEDVALGGAGHAGQSSP